MCASPIPNFGPFSPGNLGTDSKPFGSVRGAVHQYSTSPKAYPGEHELRTPTRPHLPDDKIFNNFLLLMSEYLLRKSFRQYGKSNALVRITIVYDGSPGSYLYAWTTEFPLSPLSWVRVWGSWEYSSPVGKSPLSVLSLLTGFFRFQAFLKITQVSFTSCATEAYLLSDGGLCWLRASQ